MTTWAKPGWAVETRKALGAYYDIKERPRVTGAEKVYMDEYWKLRGEGVSIDEAKERAKRNAGI